MAEGKFREFIERVLRDKFDDNKSRLAAELKLHDSSFWRQVEEKDTVGWQPILRLAIITGEPPLELLRTAGKNKEADLLGAVFTGPATPLSDVDRALLALPQRVKAAQLNAIRAAQEVRDGPSEGEPPAKSTRVRAARKKVS